MRFVLGIIVWSLLLLGLVFHSTDQLNNPKTENDLITFLTKPRKRYEIVFDQPTWLHVGDPVITYGDDGAPQTIGNVRMVGDENAEEEVKTPAWVTNASIELYSSVDDLGEDDTLQYMETPDSIDWVVKALLPPEKRNEIGGIIHEAYSQYQLELTQELKPIFLRSLREISIVIQDEFYRSLAKHETEIQVLSQRYQRELVEKDLIPLVKDEIWPIVQQQTSPVAIDIGEAMWQKASVWRFAWRLIYDRSPLPEKNLVRKEFNRFMDQYGIPIIESRIPDLLEAQKNILKKASENKEIKGVLSQSALKVVRDSDFQLLVSRILNEVFVDNIALEEVIQKNLSSQQTQAALELTNRRLDPYITKIGQALFGSPTKGIPSTFSRILRNKILFKDDRWLLLTRTNESAKSFESLDQPLRVTHGVVGIENPFFVPAKN